MQSSSNIFWIAKNIEKNFQKQLIVIGFASNFSVLKNEGNVKSLVVSILSFIFRELYQYISFAILPTHLTYKDYFEC